MSCVYFLKYLKNWPIEERNLSKYGLISSSHFSLDSVEVEVLHRRVLNYFRVYYLHITIKFRACFFLDLRKVFDTIDHSILIRKLERYCFRGRCCSYLTSYYTNRKEYANLKGAESDQMNISYGVPQGSILDPLCFSLFINDLPLAVTAETVLFADDAAFVIKSTSLEDLWKIYAPKSINFLLT